MRRAFIGLLIGFAVCGGLLLARMGLVVWSLGLQLSASLKVLPWLWIASVGTILPAVLLVAVLHALSGTGDDDEAPKRIRSPRPALVSFILGMTAVSAVTACVISPRVNRLSREALQNAISAAVFQPRGMTNYSASLPRGTRDMGPFELARKIAQYRPLDHSGCMMSREYSAALQRQLAISVACFPMSLCAVGLACHRGRKPLALIWTLGAGVILAYMFAMRGVVGGQLGISALVVPWAMLGGIAVVGAILIVISRD